MFFAVIIICSRVGEKRKGAGEKMVVEVEWIGLVKVQEEEEECGREGNICCITTLSRGGKAVTKEEEGGIEE